MTNYLLPPSQLESILAGIPSGGIGGNIVEFSTENTMSAVEFGRYLDEVVSQCKAHPNHQDAALYVYFRIPLPCGHEGCYVETYLELLLSLTKEQIQFIYNQALAHAGTNSAITKVDAAPWQPPPYHTPLPESPLNGFTLAAIVLYVAVNKKVQDLARKAMGYLTGRSGMSYTRH